MYKKIATFLGLLVVVSITSIVPSHAVLPLSCVFDSVRQTSQTTVESYSIWLNRQKTQLNNNACFTEPKTTQAIYNSLAKKALLDLQSQDKNEFNRRYDACTKGVGVSLAPSTWITSLKCLFTTSFFPTSDTLKVKFKEVIGDMKSHQPLSYIPISLGIITNIGTNWGTIACNNGSGALNFQVTPPSMSQPWKFIIPCYPPKPLQILRNLMELAVWIGFAFWLYNRGKYLFEEYR